MSIVFSIMLAVGICFLILLGMMLAWIFNHEQKREEFDGRETQQLGDGAGDHDHE